MDSENSYQIGLMPRLIRVFAGRTGNFVGFVMHGFIYFTDVPDISGLSRAVVLINPECYTAWNIR